MLFFGDRDNHSLYRAFGPVEHCLFQAGQYVFDPVSVMALGLTNFTEATDAVLCALTTPISQLVAIGFLTPQYGTELVVLTGIGLSDDPQLVLCTELNDKFALLTRY